MFYRMIRLSLPIVMEDTILHDAMQRDITIARRTVLLEILWNERYLTRAHSLPRLNFDWEDAASEQLLGRTFFIAICVS